MTSATSTSILLPDERIVMTSDRNTIVLANYRIRYSSGSGSVERFLSITLDAIASCGVVTKTQPLLLMFGALSTIGGLAQHDDSIRGILIVFGILLLLVPWNVDFFKKSDHLVTLRGGLVCGARSGASSPEFRRRSWST